MELLLACLFYILLDSLLGLFYISIGVVLVLAHVDSFDTSVGSLICSSVDFALGALIGKVMGFLLVNYLVRSLGIFL